MHAAVGGEGPPVLLLHGFPQTHVMWHRVAPALARTRTVVAADLRGYGDSSRPPAGDDHAGYSFRAMAADQHALMAALGHERYAVVGHDRGARVAHRLALDEPDAVTRAALLDILPTTHVYDSVDRRLATAYYHWFFFLQPAPVPERLDRRRPGRLPAQPAGRVGQRARRVRPGRARRVRALLRRPRRPVRDARGLPRRRIGRLRPGHRRRGGRTPGRGARCWCCGDRASVVGRGPDDPLTVWRTRARDVSGHPRRRALPRRGAAGRDLAALEEFLGRAPGLP